MPAGDGLDPMLVAAYLDSRGKDQATIARFLGVSQPQVSKLLQKAKDRGLLCMSFQPPDDLPADVLERIRQCESGVDLGARLERALESLRGLLAAAPPHIRVCESGRARPGPPTWMARLEAFGEAAAPYVERLIESSSVCGVAWGETLLALVKALEKGTRPARRGRRRIHFIPVAGYPPAEKGPPPMSASALAQRFDELVNGDSRHRQSFSLDGAPMLLPLDADPTTMSVIDRYVLSRIPAYTAIFGHRVGNGGQPAPATGEGPWIERLDAVLTSIGPVDQPFGFVSKVVLGAPRVKAELPKRVAAEVAGVLLPRDGFDRDPLVVDIAEHWRGIRMADLQRCAEQARGPRDTPGLVLLALGEQKADVVWELMRRGLANHVVVDTALAQSLAAKLEELA
jgi:DNA-binding transcriptional regulator LsrR (DeoR family)